MAERTRLGLSEISALQEGQVVWDSRVPGFGARRQKSEAVTYVLLYRNKEGRQRWYTIGRHGAPWTPDMARTKARKLLATIAEGGDPVSDKKAARAAINVADLCDQYLADAKAGRLLTRQGAAKKLSTLYTDERRIERHIKPLLGRRSVPAVTRDDVEAFMHQVAGGATAAIHLTNRGTSKTRGGKGAASKAVSILGAIFDYAVKSRLRIDNPVRGVVRFADGKRERRLSDAEYKKFGEGLTSALVAPPPIRPGTRASAAVWPDAVAAARFLLLTGWRRGEALALTWGEVDLPRRTARLADSKTGISVRPLSQIVCEILETQKPGAADGLVFRPARGEGRMGGFPWQFQRIVKAAGLPADVTPHVLRHSFASLAADLAYGESTIGALIGHKSRTITGRYIHSADVVLLAAADTIAHRIWELTQSSVVGSNNGGISFE